MSRVPRESLLRRFAAALGPGESLAVMQAVAWALFCSGALILFKLASSLGATAAALFQGAA